MKRTRSTALKAGMDILLRTAGVTALAFAYFAGASLRSRAVAGTLVGDPFAYFLAAATFLCASAGGVLTFLGAHIFDRVEVSQRWRRPDGQ